MKKSLSISLTLFFCVCISSGFILNQKTETPLAPVPTFKLSRKVNAIVQNKCYGCHSENGRAEKAKKKLMWDDLATLSDDARKEKLQNIVKVLDEGAMPPKRMLERMPDKKLTDKETVKMKKWAQKFLK